MSFCLAKNSLSSLFPPNVRGLALRGLSSGRPEGEYDVVVVGGGHNGLVAAAYLAKLGVKTAVFERRHIIGKFSINALSLIS